MTTEDIVMERNRRIAFERMYRSQVEYSIKLQRLIETYCRGCRSDELPYPDLHHSKMLSHLTCRK